MQTMTVIEVHIVGHQFNGRVPDVGLWVRNRSWRHALAVFGPNHRGMRWHAPWFRRADAA
jgi:hypothetical protein